MKIQFLGGVGEVTGSTHIIKTEKSAVMRDCGLFQGRRKEAAEKNKSIFKNIQKLDAVLLSHAHIDHSGNLPSIVKAGYSGPIHATHATCDLCENMLRDSAMIQENDVKYLNKKNALKNIKAVKPLYTLEDAEKTFTLFKKHNYHEKIQLTDDIAVTAIDAGHVLGAALHRFEVKENEKIHKIGYAFDLGRKNLPILQDPEQLQDIDTLVIECTYGDRFHKNIEESGKLLEKIINDTVKRKGKIIIPSFSLERSQEIMYVLEKLLAEQRIPEIPIYLDSPLAVKVTDVFRKHTELFDRQSREIMEAGGDFLGGQRVKCTRSVNESIALNDDKNPMIIISASGMCEGGRILHHLKNNVENPNNSIVIIGFQAQHTLGRKIVEKYEKIRIFRDMYKLNSYVYVLNTFSGHADRNDLINYIKNVGDKCKNFVLVHGEESSLQSIADELRQRRQDARIEIPQRGDELIF